MHKVLVIIYNFLLITCRLSLLGKGDLRIAKGSTLSNCEAQHIYGKGNKIIIAEGCKLYRCSFLIKGNNNVVVIGKNCQMSKTSFWIKGNGNRIEISDDTTVGNNCQFAALEGTTITVGKDCMFSHDIRLRTSDSHSIVDNRGRRINYSKNITIGNHVWVGLESLMLKGSKVADNSVVAARSIVNKEFKDKGCIIAGAPAKVIKEDINWDRKKL